MRLVVPELPVGSSTAEVLTALVVSNKPISGLFIFSYRHPPLLQQRLKFTAEEASIFQEAMTHRQSTNLPFWDSLLLCCFNRAEGYERLLKQSTLHQSHKDSLRRIVRDEIERGCLTTWIGDGDGGENYSFSSEIELDNRSSVHLPLMDFHCPETPQNDRLVQEVCRELFPCSTLIFSSGKSYHAIGTILIDVNALRTLLVRSLFFAPIIDRAYVCHQLLEGACALRLTSSSNKPSIPKLRLRVEESG